jgi:hypothetical protein
MLQFYFLSIATLVLAGFALVGASGRAVDEEVTRLLNRTWVKIPLGVVAAIVGIVKLIIPTTAESTLVIGDLLPALAGIAVGLALVVEAWGTRNSQTAEAQTGTRAASFYRIPLGIVAIGAGVAHFFVPGVVIV